MVVERKRPEGQNDHVRFHCEQCHEVVYDNSFYLTNLVKQLKPVIEAYWSDESLRTCKSCGTVMEPPAPVQS